MTDIAKKHKEARNNFFNQLSFLISTAQWNKNLYKEIETKCNFPQNYHYILFPGGGSQIIEEFESWQDQKMLELLLTEDQNLKIRKKIAKALEIRIMGIVPKAAILEQNALFLIPGNILSGAKCYSKTCDLIWRYAGDKSEDFNYYSKRGLLLCVYTSSRLFYLSDNSKDFIKTKKFIATSIEKIINIAKIKDKIKLPSVEDVPILRLMS